MHELCSRRIFPRRVADVPHTYVARNRRGRPNVFIQQINRTYARVYKTNFNQKLFEGI